MVREYNIALGNASPTSSAVTPTSQTHIHMQNTIERASAAKFVARERGGIKYGNISGRGDERWLA